MRASLSVAIVLSFVGLAHARPTAQCVDLKVMESLAIVDLTDEERAMVVTAREVRCATGEEPERWDWSNDRTARYSTGAYDYPNGRTARYSGGVWDYPNGRTARYSGGVWDYPNGKTARYSNGSYDFPDGSSAGTESDVLQKICALAPSRCKANMKIYRARKGVSRDAFVVGMIYALWPKD